MAIITRKVFDPTGTIYPNYLRRQFFDLQAAAPGGPIGPAKGGGYNGAVPSGESGPGYAAADVGENRFLPNNKVMLSRNDPDARRLAAMNPNMYQMPNVPDSEIAVGSTRDAQGNWAPYFPSDPYAATSGGSGVHPDGTPVKAYAAGGMINEPVIGIGQRTGQKYLIGEHGPEQVVPRDPRQAAVARPPRGPRRFAGRQYMNRQYLPNADERPQALDETPFSLGGKNYTTFTDPSSGKQVVRDEESGVVFEVGGSGGLSESLPMSDSSVVADSSVTDNPTIQDWVGPISTDQSFKDELVNGINDQQAAAAQPQPAPSPYQEPQPPVDMGGDYSSSASTGGATLSPGNLDMGPVTPGVPIPYEAPYQPYVPQQTPQPPAPTLPPQEQFFSGNTKVPGGGFAAPSYEVAGTPVDYSQLGSGGGTMSEGTGGVNFDPGFAGDFSPTTGAYVPTFAPEPDATTQPSNFDPYALQQSTLGPDEFNQLVA